ncbi:DUF4198 domain-containing protein [Acinetobacter sp. MD2(2019)]|uniref:DUF4198 domain-containing protein n=1 Tax=Acinetobacter sp. MD2(2019) TaxID=2605273 RepID=UPI002D1F09A6|nr:DUF4198 domain-containing protein [Acinetobacter sp. MD2(2019)]MEB3752804.1 DUF4198 domain-containing protein [Acinetobacter sp. MD2(2019)]
MKKYLYLMLFVSGYAVAHEPYIAPLAYVTQSTQVPILAGYAEEALQSEFALKNNQLEVLLPNNEKLQLDAVSNSKAATVFDLELKQAGTYTLQTKANFPLNYVNVNKAWHLYFKANANQVPPKAQRDFYIPTDFKTEPKTTNITREWSVVSYVTKEKISTPQIAATPIVLNFSIHPNQLTHNQALVLSLSKDKQAFTNAEVHLRKKGMTDKQAIAVPVDTLGRATIQFPAAGEYLIEVAEKFDAKQPPKNQVMTIASVNVN